MWGDVENVGSVGFSREKLVLTSSMEIVSGACGDLIRVDIRSWCLWEMRSVNGSGRDSAATSSAVSW